jgi:monoamine oxidase
MLLCALLLFACAASAKPSEPDFDFVNSVGAAAPPPPPPAMAAPLPLSRDATNNSANNANQTDKTPFDVVIVGAGISGIAAALHLANDNSSFSAPLRVAILEGRDRAGGRLGASKDVPNVDAGAMWIHNARAPDNPLPALAKKHGLKMSPLQDYNSGAIFDAEGKRAPVLPIASAAAAWQRSFLPALRAVKQRNNTANDESIWDVYQQTQPFVDDERENKTGNNNNNNTAVLAAARLRLASNIETLLNGDARNLSAARYGDSKTVPADDVVLEKGFSALVDAMLASADRPLDVRYGVVVEAIEQDDNENATGLVTVRTRGDTDSNDAASPIFRARRVILTTPLGVLKASVPDGATSFSRPSVCTAAWGAERIPSGAPGPITFSPPLPDAKVRAIRDFGFGRLEKVILAYGREGDDAEKSSRNLTSLEVRRALSARGNGSANDSAVPKSVFWTANRDFISREPPVVAVAAENNGASSFPPFSVYLNYYKTLNRPILVALNAGSAAERAAALGDPDAIAAAADAVLDRLYPPPSSAAAAATRPPPSRYDVTDWAGDPFSRGSYSYFAVGNAREITAELAKPVGRVHFAGEHTSEKAPATVHGALLSGEREARLVMEALMAV